MGVGSGASVGRVTSIMSGGNFWEGTVQGFTLGAASRGIAGGVEGLKTARSNNVNPWTGKPNPTNANIEQTQIIDGKVVLSRQISHIEEKMVLQGVNETIRNTDVNNFKVENYAQQEV